MLWIREETPQDYEAIREVNRLALHQEAEGQMVDRLRADGWSFSVNPAGCRLPLWKRPRPPMGNRPGSCLGAPSP